ncbi:Exonuclease- RNase T/DNA polymerase III [Apiospora marii]|uniref:Exonuclease- RNase T/DNA polymerase III n=1 Tax=Apiospora marii TaxID=335849 RepID=A0ABR1SBM3_9PEZI
MTEDTATDTPYQCFHCPKRFKKPQDLANHSRAKGHHPQQAVVATTMQHDPTGSNFYQGHQYSPDLSADRSTIYPLLLERCHPRSRLESEGYPRQTEDELANGPTRRFFTAPNSQTARLAVVLDCEMAATRECERELISICALDFLTGEVLVKSLVKPPLPVVQWKSDIHGITPTAMAVARANGQTLDGPQGARAELWKHVGEDTVLVGHALGHDLNALGIAHQRVVDSSIVTAEAVFGKSKKQSRRWGLAMLCKDLLGLAIRRGRGVHDDLEDALAARELVLLCLRQPVALAVWANQARSARSQRQTRGRGGFRGRARKQRAQPPSGDYDDEVEVVRFRDVVDWDMWPKSSPDWSD